ncbi:MAG: alanine:cation symporter family protein [Kiritimatiellae bacterium]|nr:alanine:cation symporter family protein [Kiritimatiellia bacterium]
MPDWLVSLTKIVNSVDDLIWGIPLIVAILATGILLSVLLRFRHLLHLGNAFRYVFHQDDGHHGEVSAFGALCTALSATIGTGNIVGVATAITTGGPGALFWMEVAALFGMATKYAEGLLAVKYREVAPDGRVLGGPFYYIERGLGSKWKPLAVVFAVFGMGAGLLGIGTLTQVHGIVAAAQRFFDPAFNPTDPATGITVLGTVQSPAVMIAGIVVTACVALVVIGGLQRIAKVSMVVVPFMAVSYTLVCLLVMFGNYEKIPAAVMTIVKAAFDPAAVTGGAVGTIFIAMQKGLARGIFSNEAGLGSEPIAAAAAKTNEPAKQGFVSMTGTFIDTFVVCTMTGLTIVLSGAWDPSLKLEGVNVTVEAFTRGLAFLPCAATVVPFFLMMALAFFAFTTILGWDYYSEKCLEYLVGMNRPVVIKVYRFLYVAMVAIGPYLTLSVVWGIADIFNGLMAFPNLIALMLLSPVVVRVTRDFLERR